MSWHPVTFTDDADEIGTVHLYKGARPGFFCVDTLCGVELRADHGVVGDGTSKPWCAECERISERDSRAPEEAPSGIPEA